MSPEAQRIAIAEACGFTVTILERNECGRIERVWCDYPAGWRRPDARPWLPDFLGNLNAMHEAEKTLTLKDREIYYEELGKVSEWFTICSTAAQRAEAFLRTKGLWKE